MKRISSLYLKIISWFLLNLILVSGLLAVFFLFQSQLDIYSLLGRQGSNRVRAASMIISHDLGITPKESWNSVLLRHANVHGVDFILILPDGSEYSSKQLNLPAIVKKKALNRLKRRPFGNRFKRMHGRNFNDFGINDDLSEQNFSKRNLNDKRPRHLRNSFFMMKTTNPSQYWAGAAIPISYDNLGPALPAFILAVSGSVTGNGFFFDPLPWVTAAAAVILISFLFWIPMIRHITKPVTRITNAAEKIAMGDFNVYINEKRSDEIGRLARKINYMSGRLSGLIKGQKRFLGDVAHELGSPIARIQFGLGALEQRVDEKNRERVLDIMEDIDHMSKLVNELLAFTRADMKPESVKLERINILSAVKQAVKLEADCETRVNIDINSDFSATASNDLLIRALGNLIRNSIRYAGKEAVIEINAEQKNKSVEITVADNGPGVSKDLLDQIFEPFFRPDPSRHRDFGGVGLGLSIVKTCIETCKGSVSAQNRKAGGLCVKIVLNA